MHTSSEPRYGASLTGHAPGKGCPRTRKGRLVGLARCAALVAGALVSAALSASPAAAARASMERSAAGRAPGTIFVANAGEYNGGGGTGKGSVTAYRPGAKGNARPELVITAGIDNPQSIAFDRSGDLWVANEESGTVTEYSKAELAEASPVPTVTIRLVGPEGDAFSPSGDLWVGNSNNTVVELTKAELKRSGSPKPVASIGTNYCSIAFDPSGDLWEGNEAASVFEWTKAQLAKSGSPKPRVTISSIGLAEPCRPTFDSAGDLWAANYNGVTVVEFTKAQLAKSGARRPHVTINPKPSSSDPDGLNDPGDVAFDHRGDLWVPNAGGEAVVELTKPQLAKSGSPTPARIITGPATWLNWPWSLAIEP
jgi:DNA-binding beta-propeller fold protein YncE